jgi:methionyl-tRNA formyltransferase
LTLRVIFAGTPEFARVALAQIHAAGHDVVLVLTQPDRPSGRGLKLQPSAVKQFALDHCIPIAQPRSLKSDGKYPDDAAQARVAIANTQADVMVVAAYGLILPQDVLKMPRLGCLNIHGSLLPRWRGAAPIHRAIEAGDAQTGITIMQMDVGLDTGDMLLVQTCPIAPLVTTGQLHDQLAALGSEMIVRALALAESGGLVPVKQPEQGITYAHKVEKSEAAIDWSQPATDIVRRICAFNPNPGAHTTKGGETLKVWRAEVVDTAADVDDATDAVSMPQTAVSGQIVALVPVGIDVYAMNSVVRLTELQRAGGKRLSAGDFLRGFPLAVGDVLK